MSALGDTPVFTETEVTDLLEGMRAQCEMIARIYARDALRDGGGEHAAEDMAIEIADAIAALRRGEAP